MKFYSLLVIACVLLLQACATNDELFSEYDTACLNRKAPVVIEKTGSLWEPAVYFEFDIDTLTADGKARLDSDIKVLLENPDWIVSVQGFTDQKGSLKYNNNLANRRNEAVVSYFLSHGIDRRRIKFSAIGEWLPILAGDSPEERKINRRVELMLLDAQSRPLAFSLVGNPGQ